MSGCCQLNRRLEAKFGRPPRTTAIIESQQFGACAACREVQRVGEIDSAPAIPKGDFNRIMILYGDTRQGDQMHETCDDLVGRLLGHGAQHPFELEHDGFGHEYVATRQELVVMRACAASSRR